MNEKGVNKQSVFSTIGARNYAENDRHGQDFYATDPAALDLLFSAIHINKDDEIWECCSGHGHLSKGMRDRGFTNVSATELYYRDGALDNKIDYGLDFLFDFGRVTDLNVHIVTNPPYKLFIEFVEQSLHLVGNGRYVCMFVPIRYLSGKARRVLFDKYPPYKIIISSGRISCAMNGDFDKHSNSAIDCCWFVWKKGYSGDTITVWR